MNDKQIKFIDRLYKDLYLNDSLKKHTTSKDKYKSIKEYIEFLESIHNRIIDHNHIDILKKMYYDKYVIKEENIPDSYYKHQEEMYLERGFGHIEILEDEKRELNEIIINDQKKSLDKWLDYFLSSDSNYIPYWAKYWAFQGMLKLGNFNKETGKYTKRTKHTVSKFADLNREALALSIDTLLKYLDKKDINDQELEQLVKTGSFQSIYTYITNKILSDNTNIIKRNIGKWIKYDQGSDHMPLVNSLQGYNTGWCTAGEETAKSQLAKGDFYVYYTLDENDDYKVPRIAIRMEGNSIGEIRGIASGQNLEPEMEEVVKEKIKDFPDKEKYYKKANDMKILTKIYSKYQNKEELTKEELRILYEVDSDIDGFGYEKDPRIKEIINNRNKRKDLAYIFDIDESEVALSQCALDEKTVVYYGDLIVGFESKIKYSNLKIVFGDVNFNGLVSTDNLNNLEIIKGYATFNNLINARGLKKLKYIGGYANFSSLKYSSGLNNLEYIGGGAFFPNLIDSTSLVNLKYIGGDASFNSLKDTKGLENLEIIGFNANFKRVTNARGLKKLKYIKGNAFFDLLNNSDGLENLENIEFNAYFPWLKSAKGLCSLKTIGSSACFRNLESADGLKKLKYIGGEQQFGKFYSLDGFMKYSEIPKKTSDNRKNNLLLNLKKFKEIVLKNINQKSK